MIKYSPILLLYSVGGHAMPKIVGTNDADTIVGTEENDRIWALAEMTSSTEVLVAISSTAVRAMTS